MRYHNKDLSDTQKNEVIADITSFIASLDSSPEKASIEKSIFKKFIPSRTDDPKLKATAYATFIKTEAACVVTDRRVRSTWHGNESYASVDVLHIAQRKIREILGSFSIDEMLDRGRFGPGATFGCRGADVSRARKFSLTDVTPEFNSLARGLLADLPLWSRSLAEADLPVCPMLEVVPGARLSFVPKDTKTYRSMLIEPTINSWFQQAIGLMIRERLKRASVNLNDNTLNKLLARLGSLADNLATIDLSSASDLISKNIVKDLLPERWYFWLNATRSHRYEMNGEWHELKKFSSMGNGFTFDLESLIFYAISWAITVKSGLNPFWVNVFGDDIVVPTDKSTEQVLCKEFENLGFSINRDKSFFSGPFRESCGSDYYLGRDIRGVYVKGLFTKLDLVKVHNRFWSWSNRTGICTKQLRRKLREKVCDVPVVPEHLGDVGIWGHFDEVTPQVAYPGSESFKIICLEPVFLKTQRNDRFLLLDRLQGSEFARNTVHLRKDPVGYRFRQVISPWY